MHGAALYERTNSWGGVSNPAPYHIGLPTHRAIGSNLKLSQENPDSQTKHGKAAGQTDFIGISD